MRTANFPLPAGLGLHTANFSLPAGLGLHTTNFPLPAGLGLHSARTINLQASLGLRSANSSNLSADVGLHTASQNSNKMFHLIVRYVFTVRFKQQYQSQLQQDLVNLSLLNTFSIAKLDSLSIKAFKFIVASHYSKTFLHFSKGFAIFCEGEGDQESANNGKDDEVIVWQKSNLPSLL